MDAFGSHGVHNPDFHAAKDVHDLQTDLWAEDSDVFIVGCHDQGQHPILRNVSAISDNLSRYMCLLYLLAFSLSTQRGSFFHGNFLTT